MYFCYTLTLAFFIASWSEGETREDQNNLVDESKPFQGERSKKKEGGMGAKNQVCAQSSRCEGGEKQVWAQRSRCGHI